MANILKENPDKAGEIAESLYEIAVKFTQSSKTTNFLEDVVTGITQEFNKAPKNFDQFLSKVANDHRLSLDDETAVINRLIKNGNQEVAMGLLKKLDTTGRPAESQSKDKNNCAP